MLDISRVIGEEVTEVTFLYPMLLFGSNGQLTIECAWRMLDPSGQIIAGNYELKHPATSDQVEQKLIGALLNKKVIDAKLFGISDLELTFENKYRLQAINHSGLYEGWNLRFGDSACFTLPGGKLSGY
jgi:hypothetical protein